MTPIEKMIQKTAKSCFNLPAHSVDLPLGDFPMSLLRYLNRLQYRAIESKNEPLNIEQVSALIFERVPEFQRQNDKWTPLMQARFIKNIINGFKGSPLMLYTIEKGDMGDCFILDGLQRITAILCFFGLSNMVIDTIDDDDITNTDIIDSRHFIGRLIHMNIPIKVFTFDNHIEAAAFYIQINEGITHSEEDINRAQEFINAAS